MSEIDPVIFDFKARVGGYVADVRRTTDVVDRQLGMQERRVQSLEKAFARSSRSISSDLKGMAGTLATYFTGRELVGLLDNFTRFQNQLKVAGFEGERLAEVQDRLSTVANKYGVSLEAVGTLFGRNSSSAKELNLTFDQQLKIVEATSAALKVNGTSATEASGALLQLSQVLGGTKVQAEEYNSLIDGARPLLKAVADGSDRWAGSVAKLTADVKGGNVSVREFVDALLKGSGGVIKQAEQSTLTLAGAFTVLQNKLTEYVGGAASANGVTGELADSIGFLADNLDTVIPAIAVIATALGVRYVAATGAAIAGTVAASNAMFALQARAAGAATSTEALSFALGGLKGGLISAAVLAFGAAFYYLSTNIEAANVATGTYAKAQAEASGITKRAATAAEQLATAHGKARVEALALARAEAENIKQKLASARASVALAQAELARVRVATGAREAAAQAALISGGDPLAVSGVQIGSQKAELRAGANLAAANKTVADLSKALDGVNAAINGAAAPAVKAVGTSKGKSGGGGSSGKSAADIARQQADELSRLNIEELQAKKDLAASAEDRADLEKQILEEERQARIREIEAKSELSRAQKNAQIKAVESLYGKDAQVDGAGNITVHGRPGLRQQAVNRDLENQQLNLQIDAMSRQRAALEAESQTAASRQDRLAIERRINALLEEEERKRLEMDLATGQIAEADKVAARRALERVQGARRDGTEQQGESPLEAYARSLSRSKGQISDQVEGLVISELQSVEDGITDALSKALGTKDPLITGLIRLFIQQNILGPLAEGLAGAGGGGGGIFGDFLGSISGPAEPATGLGITVAGGNFRPWRPRS